MFNTNSSPNIKNVQFLNNSAIDNGGGLNNQEFSYPDFENTIFKQNTAYNGGGIFQMKTFQSNYYPTQVFLLTGIRLESNVAVRGGGIYIADGGVDIQNIKIIGNQAIRASYGAGGGIYNDKNPITLTNVLLAKNYSVEGGAIYLWKDNCTITNTTITENTDQNSDMQTISTPNSKLDIYNSILYYNNTFVPSTTLPPHNCFNSLIDQVTFSGTPNNNLDWWNKPMFIPSSQYDYQLDVSSPCIDAGDNNFYPANYPPFDLAGNSRIMGNNIDMGAYERFQTTPAPIAGTGNSTNSQEQPQFQQEQQPQTQNAVSEPATDWKITVSPNPTTDKLTINSEQIIINAIEIYNVVGQKVYGYQVQGAEYELDVSDLANGMYFLKITTADGTRQMKKFVKE
jgi:hypothetical protein